MPGPPAAFRLGAKRLTGPGNPVSSGREEGARPGCRLSFERSSVQALARSTRRSEIGLALALHTFRREHEQHVEGRNNVRTERIAREERPPPCSIRSSKHVHFDRVERLAAGVTEDAVFRAKPSVFHAAILSSCTLKSRRCCLAP